MGVSSCGFKSRPRHHIGLRKRQICSGAKRGDVAKWLRRRSAKPLSAVRIRPSPPSICGGISGAVYLKVGCSPSLVGAAPPACPSSFSRGGGMVDAADLKSAIFTMCGFESLLRHQLFSSRIKLTRFFHRFEMNRLTEQSVSRIFVSIRGKGYYNLSGACSDSAASSR